MKAGGKKWTAEEDIVVILGVKDGKSLGEIAKGLGRSRNSVISRWHRRLRQVAEGLSAKLLPKAKQAKKATPVSKAKPVLEVTPTSPSSPASVSARVSRQRLHDDHALNEILSLRRDQCRWIEGSLDGNDWFYCRNRAVVGSYCAIHARRVYWQVGGEDAGERSVCETTCP